MKKPILLAYFVFILDQMSKFVIVQFIPHTSIIPVIKPISFFNVVNFHNTGIAFSILQNNNSIFLIFVSLFLCIIAVYLYKCRNKLSVLQKYAFCLVLAGGLGNLTDRIFRGWVIDFLDFGINSLRWPAFNIADSAVCVAAGLLVLSLLKDKNDF